MPSRSFFLQRAILNWVANGWPGSNEKMGAAWVLSNIRMCEYWYDEIRAEFNRLVS